MADTKDRPVLTGLIALVAVAAVIGIIGGMAVFFGSKMAGLDGDPAASFEGESSATSDRSLYLPEPTITSETVEPESAASPTVDPVEPPESESTSSEITLVAAQQSVSPMQQIDLTGTYPAGEGAILQVQRLEAGNWEDFPATIPVNGETFSTYLLTAQAGENTFRVIDSDKDVMSNEVVVTVG